MACIHINNRLIINQFKSMGLYFSGSLKCMLTSDTRSYIEHKDTYYIREQSVRTYLSNNNLLSIFNSFYHVLLSFNIHFPQFNSLDPPKCGKTHLSGYLFTAKQGIVPALLWHKEVTDISFVGWFTFLRYFWMPWRIVLFLHYANKVARLYQN